MNITVYTTSSCPFCIMLTNYLRGKGLEYNEKKVDQDKEAQSVMVKESGGFMGVPFIVIEKSGAKETVIGFDKNGLDRILGVN